MNEWLNLMKRGIQLNNMQQFSSCFTWKHFVSFAKWHY